MSPLRLTPGSADALLFDLGRVVLDIDFSRAMACWARHGGCDVADVTARFSGGEAIRQYESGKIDDAAYFAHLRKMLGVDITHEQLLEGWNAIFIGEMPGIAPLLSRAAKRLPLYALSNTNPPHIAHFSRVHADLLGHFVNADGEMLDIDLSARATSMSAADLRKHRIVAIGGGLAKLTALRAVLRSGLLHGLIIDEVTAQALANDKPEATSGKTKKTGLKGK